MLIPQFPAECPLGALLAKDPVLPGGEAASAGSRGMPCAIDVEPPEPTGVSVVTPSGTTPQRTREPRTPRADLTSQRQRKAETQPRMTLSPTAMTAALSPEGTPQPKTGRPTDFLFVERGHRLGLCRDTPRQVTEGAVNSSLGVPLGGRDSG